VASRNWQRPYGAGMVRTSVQVGGAYTNSLESLLLFLWVDLSRRVPETRNSTRHPVWHASSDAHVKLRAAFRISGSARAEKMPSPVEALRGRFKHSSQLCVALICVRMCQSGDEII